MPVGVCGQVARRWSSQARTALAAEVAEPLGVARDGDAPVGQVKVVEGEVADGLPAGGVDGGQGDDQPLPWEVIAGPTARISSSVIGSRLGSGCWPSAAVRGWRDQAVLLGGTGTATGPPDRGVELVTAELVRGVRYWIGERDALAVGPAVEQRGQAVDRAPGGGSGPAVGLAEVLPGALGGPRATADVGRERRVLPPRRRRSSPSAGRGRRCSAMVVQ